MVPAGKELLFVQDSHGFDLDQVVRVRQLAHLDQRVGGRIGVEVAGTDFSECLNLRHVQNVCRGLGDVAESRSDGIEGRRIDSLKKLLCRGSLPH